MLIFKPLSIAGVNFPAVPFTAQAGFPAPEFTLLRHSSPFLGPNRYAHNPTPLGCWCTVPFIAQAGLPARELAHMLDVV